MVGGNQALRVNNGVGGTPVESITVGPSPEKHLVNIITHMGSSRLMEVTGIGLSVV